MSERPTLETEVENDLQCELAAWELLREARELLASEKITRNHIIQRGIDIQKERDEAREALADWENAAAHVEADHPDEKHCGCVSVLRKLLADARSERDEAKQKMADALQEVDLRILDFERMKKERDEAREELKKLTKTHLSVALSERDDALNQIQGWENKWKAAVEMAAIAENKVSSLEDQVDLAMKTIKRLEANQP